MQLRAEMQEMTLKYENQRTVAESLESIKKSLQKSHTEMNTQFIALQSANERLTRQVHTKEQLILAQDEEHKHYVRQVRSEHATELLKFKERIENERMAFEELRTHAVGQYEFNMSLREQVVTLKKELREQTDLKERYVV